VGTSSNVGFIRFRKRADWLDLLCGNGVEIGMFCTVFGAIGVIVVF
jgi:hypothetical protein